MRGNISAIFVWISPSCHPHTEGKSTHCTALFSVGGVGRGERYKNRLRQPGLSEDEQRLQRGIAHGQRRRNTAIAWACLALRLSPCAGSCPRTWVSQQFAWRQREESKVHAGTSRQAFRLAWRCAKRNLRRSKPGTGLSGTPRPKRNQRTAISERTLSHLGLPQTSSMRTFLTGGRSMVDPAGNPWQTQSHTLCRATIGERSIKPSPRTPRSLRQHQTPGSQESLGDPAAITETTPSSSGS